MSVPRQFMILVLTFAVAWPATLGTLSYVLDRKADAAWKVAAEGNANAKAMFALTNKVSQVQGIIQRLVREKDVDTIERLMAQQKEAIESAHRTIRAAGLTGGVAAQFDSLISADAKAVDHVLRGDYGRAQEVLIGESNAALEALMSEIGKIEESRIAHAASVASDMERSARRSQISAFAAAGIVLVSLVAFAVAMVRRMAGHLSRTMTRLRQASDSTATAASEVVKAAQSLAHDSSRQAATLEEISASADEISTMSQRNAEHALLSEGKMNETAAQVATANARLDQLTDSMKAVSTASGEVSKIIRTIDGIAFQTNILALNAAVEAARAGESGAGFAVVADEVRNLAQRCAQAASDTSALIEDSTGKSRNGEKKLNDVATSIISITAGANAIKTLLTEIQVASEQQSQGVRGVSSALSQMGELTQRTAATAQESASVGEHLASEAVSLQALVDQLGIMVHGRISAARRERVNVA